MCVVQIIGEFILRFAIFRETKKNEINKRKIKKENYLISCGISDKDEVECWNSFCLTRNFFLLLLSVVLLECFGKLLINWFGICFNWKNCWVIFPWSQLKEYYAIHSYILIRWEFLRFFFLIKFLQIFEELELFSDWYKIVTIDLPEEFKFIAPSTSW